MDLRLFASLEVKDKLEITLKGLPQQTLQTEIMGFDKCPGQHPILLVTSEGDWKGLKLICGDYVIKRILTLDKCVICGAETSYTKGTPPENRKHYENGQQTCAECAKKKD